MWGLPHTEEGEEHANRGPDTGDDIGDEPSDDVSDVCHVCFFLFD